MSDEEEQVSEEEEAEEETPREEEAEAEPAQEAEEEKPKAKRVETHAEDDGKEMTEAEKAMLQAKKKHEEEEATKLKEYEEQRRIQREIEEEELRMLKEKQERRRKEREEEERQMAERRQQEEERRRQEEEERKRKAEEEKKKKEAEKLKRQAMMAGQFAAGAPGQPNFSVPKKDKTTEKFDKFGNIVKAKAEMGMTKDQQEEQKRRALIEIIKPLQLEGLDVNSLRAKIKELHQRICKLEADKYDLEKRHERQEYDLKELNERQRQINRNKALKKGLDPDAAEGRFPPKVAIVSKYDRQTDRRSFKEKRQIYDIPRTLPHFPNIPMLAQEMKKEIFKDKTDDDDDNYTYGGDDYGGDGGGEEEEE